MTVRFLLVCEGSSDSALMTHIRRLLVQYGLTDPQGTFWARGGPLADKIREALEHSGDCDLLFVHRDADSYEDTHSAGPKRRRAEIINAVSDASYTGVWVGLIPVQMTEAWLILNESAIRWVAGRPRGTEPLGLPHPSEVEGEPDPKNRLGKALIAASGTSGRRRRRFERDLPQFRRQLLENLPIGELLEQVPSWVRFREQLATALSKLDPAATTGP